MKQSTSAILMIRPAAFGFNHQTAASNAFQSDNQQTDSVHEAALKEFDAMVVLLKQQDVDVIVIEDTAEPRKPDAIFPNNWISFHENGDVLLYPMQAENRRLERREDIIRKVEEQFFVNHVIDLSRFEIQEKFLEGTGSMVLDRENKIAYACISPRTDTTALQQFCDYTGYRSVSFHAMDDKQQAIYHTNVLMCMGSSFAVICLQSIADLAERQQVEDSLKATGKHIIEISFSQLQHFAGNMLEVINLQGECLLVMSARALQSLNAEQIKELSHYAKIVAPDLTVIETIGGGSARCMMAEIHLPLR
ncbi:citrulline utilization hydrolase CtlX [Mucilaginibacter sp.]